MNKLMQVAIREFLATVLTKAFLLGILIPPVIMGGVIALMPLLMNQKPPRTEGRVALIDQSGLVGPLIDAEFTPEKFNEAAREKIEESQKVAKQLAPQTRPGPMNMAVEQALRTDSQLTLEKLDAGAGVDDEKSRISTSRRRDEIQGTNPRLALVVIPKGAVDLAAAPKPTDAGAAPEFQPFDMFVAPTLDIEVKNQVENAVERAITNARLRNAGMDQSVVRQLTRPVRSNSITVTDQGERKSNDAAKMFIPAAFMFLLWMSVFTSGQSLLSSTIEEKSSRVMEVLLSAASPMQIMVGKILGQMGVGLLMLGVYGGAGIAALIYFALDQNIDPMNILYFAVYFVIAFFLIACMMSAIGSAVSELREAQTLMTPVMLVLIIPMVLWMPILRNPNSVFAQVCSFVPPVSPFVMVLRIAGSEPVPFWQIPVSMAIGIVSVFVAAWAASKIFRIGVLMYGKPPNLRTLLSWVRAA
ncbi:MAG TPA: ABC transporter permease [Phycisphaerales bacterium]|nr:ABC transporter permease [Phycisphaerales bacterium]